MENQNEESMDAERPTISLHDIAAVVQILDVCTARAVWKPQELSGVGKLYDKLVVFLDGAGYKTTKSVPEGESNA